MCGIAGFFQLENNIIGNPWDKLRGMAKVLVHRGPDDYGEYLEGHCGLVFRRLSIIDLEHGNQPMFSSSKDMIIVFNGEIYNFKELKRELEGHGAVFLTDSDTEVILAGYEIWGIDVVKKLRGIFAFAVFDKKKRRLFIARDHTGIKPFYYIMRDGIFVFASEIKAILEFPGISASVNIKMLPRFMSFLWVPAPDTLFENIFILEPGHMMIVDEDGIKKKRYWNPDLLSRDCDTTEQTWNVIIDSEIRRAVKEQLISDVPLGAFLSGGVDSSTIVAYMNQVSDKTVTTYSIGFSDDDISNDVIPSELKYARWAAGLLEVDYNEIIPSAYTDIEKILPLLTWHMDEPITDPAAITTYFICKAAKEKCTVMLSGVGGDEIFGGYPRYIANYLAKKYQNIPISLRKLLIEPCAKRIPTGSNALIRNFKKFIRSADMPFEERYFGYLTYYSQFELADLLKMSFEWSDIFESHRHTLTQYKSKSSLRTMMNLDLMTFLPYLNLMYTDKMSSAASVEVRVPYLDHILIEKVARMPEHFKVKGLKRKYILKKISEEYLPAKLVWRKKAGFGAPIGAWLKGQLRHMMFDLLSEETVKRRGYFKYSAISRLISNHLEEKEYNANQLWQLMMLELWHQVFID